MYRPHWGLLSRISCEPGHRHCMSVYVVHYYYYYYYYYYRVICWLTTGLGLDPAWDRVSPRLLTIDPGHERRAVPHDIHNGIEIPRRWDGWSTSGLRPLHIGCDFDAASLDVRPFLSDIKRRPQRKAAGRHRLRDLYPNRVFALMRNGGTKLAHQKRTTGCILI